MPPSEAQTASLLPPPSAGDFRTRLVAGMAQAIRDHGSFGETTVAEVVRHARTSRRTFYAHFADREACFLALFDELSRAHLTAVSVAAGVDVPWAERVDRAITTYLDALAAEPVVSRTCLQEVWSLGPAGVARAQEANEEWARRIAQLVEDARAVDPSLRPMSLEVAIVITGGFRDIVLAALNRGEDVTVLHGVATDLIRRLAAA